MITDTFLAIVQFFLEKMLLLFPNGSGFPPAVHTSAQTVGGYVGILSPVFPIETLYQVLVYIIVIEIAILGFKSLKWLLSHVPFVGGRG